MNFFASHSRWKYDVHFLKTFLFIFIMPYEKKKIEQQKKLNNDMILLKIGSTYYKNLT